jgi:hypothetical protein
MMKGQNLVVGTPGGGVANFLVNSILSPTSVRLTYLGFSGDLTGTVVAGALLSPSVGNLSSPGISTPISIANGGTSAATKAAAQVALGLGQINSFYYGNALAQAFTNAYASVGGALSIAASGIYLLLSRVTVDWIGVTFASQRTMNFKLKDITAGTDLTNSEIARVTGVVTTTTIESSDYDLPPLGLSLTVGHQIQLFMKVDTVASAGTHQVSSVAICPVPLSLS